MSAVLLLLTVRLAACALLLWPCRCALAASTDEVQWQQVSLNTTGGAPSARRFQSAVLAADGTMLMFGGQGPGWSTSVNAELWRLTLTNGASAGSWQRVSITGSDAPSARAYQTSVMASDGSMIMFGGSEDGSNVLDDVWRFTPTSASTGWWQRLAVAGPALARNTHTSVMARDGTMVTFGGVGRDGLSAEVWRLTFVSSSEVAWQRVSTTGSAAAPSARCYHASIMAGDGSMYTYGGLDGSASLGDVWRLTFTDNSTGIWQQVSITGGAPSARRHPTFVLSFDGTMLTHGGMGPGISNTVNGELWRLNLTDVASAQWQRLAVAAGSAAPSARSAHTMLVTPDGSVLIYGGWGGWAATSLNDVWRSSPLGPAGTTRSTSESATITTGTSTSTSTSTLTSRTTSSTTSSSTSTTASTTSTSSSTTAPPSSSGTSAWPTTSSSTSASRTTPTTTRNSSRSVSSTDTSTSETVTTTSSSTGKISSSTSSSTTIPTTSALSNTTSSGTSASTSTTSPEDAPVDGDILECSPPTLSASTDPVRDAVKVAFHKDTQQDLCHLQREVIDDAKMAEYCEAFCATGGQTSGLPLQLGSEQYGFNLEQMNQVCDAVMTFDSDLERFCADRTNSLPEIEGATAQLVARVYIFKAKQTEFRAVMQHAALELQDELASEEFQAEMARAIEKPAVLKQKFRDFAEQQKSLSASELLSAMAELRESSEQLSTAVDNNLVLFEEFVRDCNQMLRGTGSRQEYLLDICAQANIACIEKEAAGHVGCCCGFNPVVAPSFDIDGIEAAIFEGRGFVSSGRRLQSESDANSANVLGITEVNICAEARAASAAAVEAARQRTSDLGQDSLWAAQADELAANYGEYYERCGSSDRRLGSSQAAPAPTAAEQPETRRAASSNAFLSRREEPTRQRKLQHGLTCRPPASENETGLKLKVAFSNTLEEDVCHLQQPPVQNADMWQQCTEFCAGHGVSMLLGSQTYGLNLQEAESICLPPDGVLKHDPDKLRQCGLWSAAFPEVEVTMTQFIAQLDVFTAMRLLYVSQLRNATKDIQEFVASEEFAASISRAVDKESLLTEAIQERIKSAGVQQAEAALSNVIASLRHWANALSVVLNENMALFERYLNECNDMYVGEGAQSEYLLDICAQQNDACFENDAAGHVSCCCAYHPFTTFGEPAPATTINGIADFDPPARVSADSDARRLSAAADGKQVLDICAQAWTDAKPRVKWIYRNIRKTGFAEVVSERDQLMQAKYGEDFCAFGSSGGDSNTISDYYYDYYDLFSFGQATTTTSSEEPKNPTFVGVDVTTSFPDIVLNASHSGDAKASDQSAATSIHSWSAALPLFPAAVLLRREL